MGQVGQETEDVEGAAGARPKRHGRRGSFQRKEDALRRARVPAQQLAKKRLGASLCGSST